MRKCRSKVAKSLPLDKVKENFDPNRCYYFTLARAAFAALVHKARETRATTTAVAAAAAVAPSRRDDRQLCATAAGAGSRSGGDDDCDDEYGWRLRRRRRYSLCQGRTTNSVPGRLCCHLASANGDSQLDHSPNDQLFKIIELSIKFTLLLSIVIVYDPVQDTYITRKKATQVVI